MNDRITRVSRTRACACSICYDHRNGRRRNTRCGRIVTSVYWTVDGLRFPTLKSAEAYVADNPK